MTDEVAVRAFQAMRRHEQDAGIRMGLRYAARVLERKGLPDAAARLRLVQPSRVRKSEEG